MFLVPSCAILFLDEPPLLLGDAELDADRSLFGHWIFASSNYNGQFFCRLGGGTPEKNIPSHISTDSFRAKTWYLFREKFSLPTLQRTNFLPLSTRVRNLVVHFTTDIFFSRLAGMTGKKILIRKSPSLYNGQFFCCLSGTFQKNPKDHSYFYNGTIFLWIGGYLQKKSFHFTTDIFSEKKQGSA